MKSHSYTIAVLGFICLSLIFVPVTYANSVTIQYFHQKGCLDCEITDPIINQTEAQYKNNNVVVSRIETSTADGFNQWNKYGFLEVPAIVINNETKIPKKRLLKRS